MSPLRSTRPDRVIAAEIEHNRYRRMAVTMLGTREILTYCLRIAYEGQRVMPMMQMKALVKPCPAPTFPAEKAPGGRQILILPLRED